MVENILKEGYNFLQHQLTGQNTTKMNPFAIPQLNSQFLSKNKDNTRDLKLFTLSQYGGAGTIVQKDQKLVDQKLKSDNESEILYKEHDFNYLKESFTDPKNKQQIFKGIRKADDELLNHLGNAIKNDIAPGNFQQSVSQWLQHPIKQASNLINNSAAWLTFQAKEALEDVGLKQYGYEHVQQTKSLQNQVNKRLQQIHQQIKNKGF